MDFTTIAMLNRGVFGSVAKQVAVEIKRCTALEFIAMQSHLVY